MRIEPASGGVAVEPLDAPTEGPVLTLLGASFDLDAFTEFAQGEPVLARLSMALRGFRPPLNPDPFETLVTSITAQQVSLFAAFAIRNRLIERLGVRAERAYAFPTRDEVAATDEPTLRALGFSARKAEYLLGLARSDLDLDALAALPDEEVKARLTELRGLGEWTADWFLARHLARPRAWPAGDLALVKAVSALCAGGAALSIREVRALGERFAPFENLAAHYLLTGMRAALAA